MNIEIRNGKALYEGLEIENIEYVKDFLASRGYCVLKDGPISMEDGIYTLPDGWDVVKLCSYDSCPDYGRCEHCQKEVVRLVREEQDNTEQTHYCGQCGKPLTLVRPGKHQCDNPDCESNRASIGPLNDKKLSIDLSIKKVENLRKEFAQVLREGITFAGQIGDYLINESVFEWIENRIGRQSNAPTKEELRKEFIDYYVNKREDQSMVDSLNHLFEKYYSQLQQRDRQINTLKDEVNDLEHDIAIRLEEISDLKKELQHERSEGRREWERLQLSEIAAQKQLTKNEIKRISDIYQSTVNELKEQISIQDDVITRLKENKNVEF